MPKKTNSNLTKQYATSHASSASKSPSTSSTAGSSSKTVSERLEQLRREQSPRPNVDTYHAISSVATQPTVPPHLRHILAIPETAPPIPRRGGRLWPRRATPGPPPPMSWLDASRHAPVGLRRARRGLAHSGQPRSRGQGYIRERPDQFSLLSRLEDAPAALPDKRSLVHQCLKSMATNWETVSEYEQFNLATMPIYLKTLLLSYLSTFTPDDVLSVETLRVLFLTEKELPGSTSTIGLSQLDLTGFWNNHFVIADFTKYFHPTKDSNRLSVEFKVLNLSESPSSGSDITNSNISSTPKDASTDRSGKIGLPDSWEDESDSSDPSIPTAIRVSRFPELRRLSLANAGSIASWPQLLNLSQHLNALTHLSLAYWPLPTITPNSRRTFVESRHGSISLGGSHLYSVMDEDWHEAANILRRLSKNTYSLRWLDIEGCGEWLPALTWVGNEAGPDRWVDRAFRNDANRPSAVDGGEGMPATVQGPHWDGSWSQLVHVNVSQGSLPRDVAGIRRLPAGLVAAELLLYLRNLDEMERGGDGKDDIIDLAEVSPDEIPQWLETEKQARKVAAKVRAIRARTKGLYCKFDYGWHVESLQPRIREIGGGGT